MSCKKGDPTLASSSSTTEEEFMQVLDEMNRICGVTSSSSSVTSSSNPEEVTAGHQNQSRDISLEDSLSPSPLEPLFGSEEKLGPPAHEDLENEDSRTREFEEESSSSCSHSPDNQVDPISVAATNTFLESMMASLEERADDRNEHNITNGNKETRNKNDQKKLGQSQRSRHGSANSSQSCVSFDSAIGDVYSVQTPPQQSVTTFEFDPDLLLDQHRQTSSSQSNLSNVVEQNNNNYSAMQNRSKNVNPIGPILHQRLHSRPSPYTLSHKTRMQPHPMSNYFRSSQNTVENIQRREVEMVCLELLHRFQHAANIHPRHMARVWISRSESDDPLLITTRLLSDTLTRLRIFLFGLEPMNWLSHIDRMCLYNSNVCCISILKSSVSVDLAALPAAYPLPYGEYLGEVEALHLILAHDLYNELKALVATLQQIESIQEFPVMLLVMMIAFFTPMSSIVQVDKVVKIHDYYAQKLQIYLSIRYDPSLSRSLMSNILSAVDKVKKFAARFREFLQDVTKAGLQKQYESVCENIGLMAFLLQSEPHAQ